MPKSKIGTTMSEIGTKGSFCHKCEHDVPFYLKKRNKVFRFDLFRNKWTILNGSDFIKCSPLNNLFLLTSTLSSGVQ